jgi:hypothetical protein
MLQCAASNEPLLLCLRTRTLALVQATETGVFLTTSGRGWKAHQTIEYWELIYWEWKAYCIKLTITIRVHCRKRMASWFVLTHSSHGPYKNHSAIKINLWARNFWNAAAEVLAWRKKYVCLRRNPNIRTSKTCSFCSSVFGIGVLASNYE